MRNTIPLETGEAIRNSLTRDGWLKNIRLFTLRLHDLVPGACSWVILQAGFRITLQFHSKRDTGANAR